MARQSRIDKYKELRENVKANTDATISTPITSTPKTFTYDTTIKNNRETDSKKSVNFNDASTFLKDIITTDTYDIKKNNFVEERVNVKQNSNSDEFDFMKAFSEFGFKKEEEEDDDEDQDNNFTNEDTLMESLTFEKINKQVDEELERALNRVRSNIGQKDYNTRLDILNRIRKASDVLDTVSDDDHQLQQQIAEENYKLDYSSLFLDDDTTSDNQEYMTINEEPVKPTERRKTINEGFKNNQNDLQNTPSDEENELLKSFFSKFKEDSDEIPLPPSRQKRVVKEETPVVVRQQPMTVDNTIDYSKRTDSYRRDQDEDEDDEDNPIIIKVLNGIIILLVIALLCIAVYFASVFLF